MFENKNLFDARKQRTANKGLNARQADALNLAFIRLFGFSAKLNICTSNHALGQAPKHCPQYLEELII